MSVAQDVSIYLVVISHILNAGNASSIYITVFYALLSLRFLYKTAFCVIYCEVSLHTKVTLSGQQSLYRVKTLNPNLHPLRAMMTDH